MLFTTRKETAKKMPIYPLKKFKLNPKKKKMVHVELDLGQDQPSLTSEMLEGIGILGGATPNWVPTLLTWTRIWVKSLAISIAVFRSVIGYPTKTMPFPTLAGKPVPLLPITALVAETKNLLCWNPMNTFHDYSSTRSLFWTVSTDSNRWGRQGEREREAKVKVTVRGEWAD